MNALQGLPLARATDPSWAEVVSKHVEHVLADHAHCELKAASTALALTGRYADDDELAQDMLALAREEMRHFASVREVLAKRGGRLPPVGPDRYVKELRRRAQRGLRPTEVGLDALLICAFVEARSCERFRILAATLEEEELRRFYSELASAEARHHELFLERRALKLTTDVEPILPQVAVDRPRIVRVLVRLVETLGRASPRESSLALRVYAEGGNVVFVVDAPAAPPFPDEESLFADDGRAPGNGFALAIAARIVRAHGGRVFAEMIPGSVRVGFTLPAARVEREAA